jgi:hypothetical protein
VCDGRADRPFVAARSRAIEHIGSSHDDVELELLKAGGRASGRGTSCDLIVRPDGTVSADLNIYCPQDREASRVRAARHP